ncbi:MAG: T9SS type A sorting domain-containing protein [Candidatus Kapabacteria bacterium]|nr:T9SS type A sorting domain-containing protein [Candidatus Kapabacteria bacterium]
MNFKLGTYIPSCILIFFYISLYAQPLQNRLLTATSVDGLNWTKTGKIFAENGEVPDALVRPDGKIAVYYQGLVTQFKDGIFVAISDNGLDNWTRYQITLSGTENWSGQPCDPDVVYFKGKYRLYFTGNPNSGVNPETHSAVSDDGINFTVENGTRFVQPGSPIMDPSLLQIVDTLHHFAGGAQAGKNWHAVSIDGLNFTRISDFQIDNLMMANGLKTPSGYRFYCFSNSDHKNLYSIYSTDGISWSRDAGVRISLDNPALEIDHIKDPAVILKNGSYIMYYVAGRDSSLFKDTSSITNFLKKYLMAFHTCTGTNCGDPKNHVTKIAESDDLINWNLIPNLPQMPGSVPDLIARGDKLYVYNPGQVRTYNNSSKVWEPSSPVSIIDSNNNKIDFVDPSPYLDSNGKIVLFFLNSTGLFGQDPAGCKTYPCVKFFDSAIEEDAADGKKFRLVPGHRLTIVLQNGSASDPDIFYDGKDYILYISRGANTYAYHSSSLQGNYNVFQNLTNSLLTSAGGVACGYYDSTTKKYYSYIHTNENGTTLIKVAVHQDFNSQLSPTDFKPAISGTLMNLGANSNCESPGITLNTLKSQPADKGPWKSPLKVAYSNDGINFTGEKIFQDSAGVPCVIRWKGTDTLACVFQWFRQPMGSATWDKVAVKFSYNNGASWSKPVPIEIAGLPQSYQRPFDPTIVVYNNDKIRIYYSSNENPIQGMDSTINTYSAVSNDGIHYTFENGARYDHPTNRVIDPAVTFFNNQWHYLSPIGAPQDGAYHCTSADGINFALQANIPSDNMHNWTGNFLVDNNELRFYGCGQNIWYNTSNDAVTWKNYIKTNINGGDPSVVKLGNNSYMMIYVGQPYNQNLPDKVILANPFDKSVFSSDSLLFVWKRALPDSIQYSFQFTTDSTFLSFYYESSDLADTFKVIHGLKQNTVYYWRVKAKNTIGWGPYSDVWTVRGIKSDITEYNAHSELNIMPNPSNDFILIRNYESENTNFTIYNTLGEQINNIIAIFYDSNTIKIDISTFPSGLYIVKTGSRIGKFWISANP